MNEISIKVRKSLIENKFILTVCNKDNKCYQCESMDIHNVQPNPYSKNTKQTFQDQVAYALVEAFKDIAGPVVQLLTEELK